MFIRQTNHEVARGSNLDLILRGFNGAFNRFTDVVGAGLQGIALALSTPHDNSAEVQKQIDQVQQKLKQATDSLQSAINTQQKER